MTENKLPRLCDKPAFDKQYVSAVSLHSHTDHSKQSLHFIPKFTRKYPILHRALEHQAKRSTIPVDLVRAYWTPPLPPTAAFEVEKRQIEVILDLMALVSLTDHDTIAAPTLLRMVAETKEVPLALEWSVRLRLLFAPNRQMVTLPEQTTGKPCFVMSHSVDTAAFSPGFRDRETGLFTIGYVGRLTAEKNVRLLAQIERALLTRGHRDFRVVILGDGAERKWLQRNMRQAEFTGVITGRNLSCTFANMDVFVFPSETDTFGLAVLEALSSGVPAVVSSVGGPKDAVQHGKTGYVANNLAEFVAFTDLLPSQPELLPAMGLAARSYALSNSWKLIFENMYRAYERCFYGANSVCPRIFESQKPDRARLRE